MLTEHILLKTGLKSLTTVLLGEELFGRLQLLTDEGNIYLHNSPDGA